MSKTIAKEQLPKLIESIRKRFEDVELGSLTAHGYHGDKGGRRTGKLHDVIALRRAHFYNRPEVDPRLPKPYDDGPAFQSDVPRRDHEQLKARLCENHFSVRAEAKNPTALKRDAANAVESYIQAGLIEIEERNGYTFQQAMSDGQIIDGIGFLHWREAYQKLPEWPDYEMRDSVAGEDDDTKKRFKRQREYTEGSASEENRYRYRETDDSLHDRRRRALAEAPFHYEAEVVSGRNIGYVGDRSCLNGLGMVMHTQVVGWLDFEEDYNQRQIHDDEGRELRARLEDAQQGRGIKLYTEQDAPFQEGPSADGWDETVAICTLWTRDHWYELASIGNGTGHVGSWVFVAHGTHEWGMPPFALFKAIGVNDPDPVLAFQPALAGVFRLKPMMDEAITLMHTMARNIAMPWFYLQPQANSGMPPILNEDGSMKTFTWDAAAGMRVPDGYDLKWVDNQMSAAYPHSIEIMREMYQDARPNTGQTDTGASSQPWTIRLKQNEANVTPSMMIDEQVPALRIMARSIAEDAARKAVDEPDESVWTMQEKDGKRELTGIPASDLRGMEIHIDIDSTSGAEKITLAQIGMEMRSAGLITAYQFWDEFWRDPDPQKRLDEVDAEQLFDMYWKPGVIRMVVAQLQGTDIVVGVDGEFSGPNGQPLSPDDILATAGVQDANPPTAPPINGQGPTQPGMGTLAPEGAVPIQAGVM